MVVIPWKYNAGTPSSKAYQGFLQGCLRTEQGHGAKESVTPISYLWFQTRVWRAVRKHLNSLWYEWKHSHHSLIESRMSCPALWSFDFPIQNWGCHYLILRAVESGKGRAP